MKYIDEKVNGLEKEIDELKSELAELKEKSGCEGNAPLIKKSYKS